MIATAKRRGQRKEAEPRTKKKKRKRKGADGDVGSSAAHPRRRTAAHAAPPHVRTTVGCRMGAPFGQAAIRTMPGLRKVAPPVPPHGRAPPTRPYPVTRECRRRAARPPCSSAAAPLGRRAAWLPAPPRNPAVPYMACAGSTGEEDKEREGEKKGKKKKKGKGSCDFAKIPLLFLEIKCMFLCIGIFAL
ncbi:hypothetical protein OsJ_35409 [Oryza sativa Japonica Group]|uniref:Uncharacterized protein n=1 Tax=Oryza sativa subsp. japonica TaxID=39947 RepID=B9GC52_ORYSJ|nr:hypothetical protein OsJ_35409 [Oryza sativa Japonica Group]